MTMLLCVSWRGHCLATSLLSSIYQHHPGSGTKELWYMYSAGQPCQTPSVCFLVVSGTGRITRARAHSTLRCCRRRKAYTARFLCAHALERAALTLCRAAAIRCAFSYHALSFALRCALYLCCCTCHATLYFAVCAICIYCLLYICKVVI